MEENSKELNPHLENSILKLLFSDTEFCRLVVGQIELKHFNSSYSRTLAKIALDFFNNFSQAAEDHFQDEIISYFETNNLSVDDRNLYIKLLEKIVNTQVTKEYVLYKLDGFIQQRAYEEAALLFTKAIVDKNYDEAKEIINKVNSCGIQKTTTGFDYFNDLSDIDKRGSKIEYLMHTGYDALDTLIGGYRRKNLIVFLAGYKGMKTWSLMHLAKTAIEHGLNVVYFSHEVSQEVICQRFDMMLTGLGTERVGEPVTYVTYNPNTESFEPGYAKVESLYGNNEKVKSTRTKFRDAYKGHLEIMEYPPDTCTAAEMERCLNQLEIKKGITADVIITDYADIMDKSKYGKETRDQLNNLYLKLRKMAVERNCLVATASQVTADALDANEINMKDISEDKRKIGNVDLALAVIGCNNKQKLNIGKIQVLANRNGIQNVSCSFSHCLTIGKTGCSSWLGKEKDEQAFSIFGQDLD